MEVLYDSVLFVGSDFVRSVLPLHRPGSVRDRGLSVVFVFDDHGHQCADLLRPVDYHLLSAHALDSRSLGQRVEGLRNRCCLRGLYDHRVRWHLRTRQSQSVAYGLSPGTPGQRNTPMLHRRMASRALGQLLASNHPQPKGNSNKPCASRRGSFFILSLKLFFC